MVAMGLGGRTAARTPRSTNVFNHFHAVLGNSFFDNVLLQVAACCWTASICRFRWCSRLLLLLLVLLVVVVAVVLAVGLVVVAVADNDDND